MSDVSYTVQTELLYGNTNDPDREDRHRIIKTEWGQMIHLRAEDPYGFVKITFEKGPLPDILSGMYTSFVEAERAVQAWQRGREKQVADALELQKKNAKYTKNKVHLTPRISADDDQANSSE